MKQELIFHLHIPKTAGSSVRAALLDSGWVMANGFKQHSIADRRGNLISGHFMYGGFPLFRMAKKTIYLTVLRDPAQQMVSMYGFVKNRPNHPFYSLTVDGFNKFWPSPELRNLQARYLAGKLVSFLYARGIIGDGILYRVAAAHLERVQFVGVQDDLNSLLSELKAGGVVGLEISSFERRNVGRKWVEFGEGVESFKAINWVDYALYSLASEEMNRGA